MPAIDTKTALFQAASEAFPDGEVGVKLLTPDHPKLAKRSIIDNQVYVRVQFHGFAVAGFVPENGRPDEIAKLIGRLKLDYRVAEDALNPKPAV